MADGILVSAKTCGYNNRFTRVLTNNYGIFLGFLRNFPSAVPSEKELPFLYYLHRDAIIDPSTGDDDPL